MRYFYLLVLIIGFSSCCKEEEYTFNISVYDAQTNLPIDTGVVKFLAICDNCWTSVRFFEYFDVNSSGIASRTFKANRRIDYFRVLYLENRKARFPRQTMTGCLPFEIRNHSCTNDRNEYNLEIRVWRE